jgi:hypothetical protein
MLPALDAQLFANDAVTKSGNELKTCYFVSALIYGSEKCDPPPLLVSAVFGKCFDAEEAVRQSVIRAEHGSQDAQNIADTVIENLRAKLSPVIQSYILDSQAKNKNCQRPTPFDDPSIGKP